jgi:hypothetical protein
MDGFKNVVAVLARENGDPCPKTECLVYTNGTRQ